MSNLRRRSIKRLDTCAFWAIINTGSLRTPLDTPANPPSTFTSSSTGNRRGCMHQALLNPLLAC
jgi:hypothetical protein